MSSVDTHASVMSSVNTRASAARSSRGCSSVAASEQTKQTQTAIGDNKSSSAAAGGGKEGANQAMDPARWSACGCCGEMAYDDGEDRMWWWDGEAWIKLICYECNDMLGNVHSAQVCLQKLFRTSQIFSLENVARHIGECLAQYWDIRRIQHLRFADGRMRRELQQSFWRGHPRFRNWILEKYWRPDKVKGEYV